MLELDKSGMYESDVVVENIGLVQAKGWATLFCGQSLLGSLKESCANL